MKCMLKFNCQILAFFCLLAFLLFSCSADNNVAKRDYYQIKIYRLKNQIQEARVETFLKEAYLPALHRAGIGKVGVFKPIEEDTVSGNIIFVWIPFNSLKQFDELPQILEKDSIFHIDGEDYIEAAYNNVPYERIESILLKAFSEMPQFGIPEYTTLPDEKIYELRSYQAPTEKLFRLKVEMFNEGGELKLFQNLGFNPVFFAEVISGSTMPNLMYMTTFSNMNSHDEHWDTFQNHPEWKAMKEIKKYENTVSRAVKYLLHPTDYSDI
jgi:hypothetical protein